MIGYFLDNENFTNLFMIGVLPVDVDVGKIDEYIEADLNGASMSVKAMLRAELGYKAFTIHSFMTDDEYVVALAEIYETLMVKTNLVITYNGNEYDNVVNDFILNNYEDLITLSVDDFLLLIKNFGNDVINSPNIRWFSPFLKDFNSPYYSCDLMALHNLRKARVPLKHLAILLKHYRIQDLPYHHTKVLTKAECDEVEDYNFNDLLITRVVYSTYYSEVESRIIAHERWGLPLYKVLSASKPKLGAMYIKRKYSEASGIPEYILNNKRTHRQVIHFGDIINPAISFNTPQLSDFLAKLKRKVMSATDEFEESVVFNDTVYNFGMGGLHSKDRPDIFRSTDKVKYKDGDVSSFYPSNIINSRYCPKHLDADIYIPILKIATDQRLVAKSTGDNLADSLKDVINSVFGLTGDVFSMLLDLYAHYATTVNGQLLLMKWIEMLSLQHFSVISANTDGLTARIPTERESEYYDISNEWASKFNFGLEFKDYKTYARLSVNNYIAIPFEGKVKRKGINFEYIPQLDKGYHTPVLAKALEAYFKDGISFREFIHNHTDIYDFCVTQKIGSAYKLIALKPNSTIADSNMQKNNRFYLSTTGDYIYKVNTDTGSRTAFMKGCRLTNFNTAFRADIKSYNIDYPYYVASAQELLDRMNHLVTKEIKGTKRKSGIRGTLFDEDSE